MSSERSKKDARDNRRTSRHKRYDELGEKERDGTDTREYPLRVEDSPSRGVVGK